MRDEKSDKKGPSSEKPQERERTEHRRDARKYVTEDIDNPLIWRGLD